MNVEKGQSPDGSSFVKIEIGSLPEGGDDEAAVPWSNDSAEDEEDEDIRTIDDLAASVGMGGEVDETAMGAASNEAAAALESSSSSTSSSNSSSADEQAAGKQAGEEEDDDEADQLQRWQQQAAAAEAEAEVRESGPANNNSGFLSRSLRDEVASMTEALLQSGNGGGFTDADGGCWAVCVQLACGLCFLLLPVGAAVRGQEAQISPLSCICLLLLPCD